VIEVTNLSSIIETESFRVDGLGNAKLLVVQCTLDRRPEIPESDPIRDLKSQLSELQTEKSAREQEVAILRAFAKSMNEKPRIAPDQANAFSDTLYDKILGCAETVRDLDESIARLTRKIDQLGVSKVGEAHAKAIITILADEDGPAQLRLIYREENTMPCVQEDPADLLQTQVYSMLVGTLSTTYTQLQRTENHLHLSLFTTASIYRRTQERIGPVQS